MPLLLGSVPDAWGPKCGTEAGAATLTRTGPNEINLNPAATLALVMLTPQPNREVSIASDKRRVALAPVGAVEVVPSGVDLFARWTVEKENLLIALDERYLAHVAGTEFGNESFEFHLPGMGHIDQKALMLGHLFRDEFLRGEDASDLYFDALITLFTTHLLRNYSSLSPRPSRLISGGLTPQTWRNVIDYIQANLTQRLSLVDMANMAGLSPSHFLRAFRRSCGLTPHQYIVSQRLTLAERLLRSSEAALSDIAKSAGFASNSHMTATMKRLNGVTPSELRRDARA